LNHYKFANFARSKVKHSARRTKYGRYFTNPVGQPFSNYQRIKSDGR